MTSQTEYTENSNTAAHDVEVSDSNISRRTPGEKSVTFSLRTNSVVMNTRDSFDSTEEDEELGANPQMKEIRKSPMTDKYTYREHIFIVIVAMILSFNSGFSNGICLSGFITPASLTWDKQSTSGFTGAYTKSALALVDRNQDIQSTPHIEFFGHQVCMILSFIGGSCLSALLNPRPSPWRLAPMYAPTFFIGSLFMCVAAIMSSIETEGSPHFYYFVAAANGVQNGISSMYSANLIRTTHLTGTSTDIGLFVGQFLRGNKKNAWKLRILIGLAVSFWTGGVTSFWAAQAWTRFALLFNAAIFFILFALLVAFIMKNLHMPLHRALQGTWHWQRTMHQLSFRSRNCGTPKPHQVLWEAFDRMDTDNDGFIHASEFHDGLREAGLETSIPSTKVAMMFEVCDKDKDGKIGFEEFKDLVLGENVLVG